jgi:hypothetical protein
MRYLMLRKEALAELVRELEAMPGLLATAFSGLAPGEAALAGPDGAFSPVEHCWHLADLERFGYAVRIARLREELDPHLPDFDGARVAREREYSRLSLAEGIEAFRRARFANLETLRGLETSEWERSGAQEGVGRIALCDLPSLMAEHDRSHRAEIREWLRVRRQSRDARPENQ